MNPTTIAVNTNGMTVNCSNDVKTVPMVSSVVTNHSASVAFVIGLSRMNSPATARNGNLVSAGGMSLAVGATAAAALVSTPQATTGTRMRSASFAAIRAAMSRS